MIKISILAFVLLAAGVVGQVYADLPPADEIINDTQRFYVDRIDLTGNSVLRDDVVEALTEPYTERELTYNDIENLRLELTRHLVERDLVNSGILVPDQNLGDGLLQLKVVEGVLFEVDLTTRTRLRPWYVKSRIFREVKQPLDLKDLQRGLQRLQRDRNISRLDARLRPGEQRGESVLELDIEEPQRFEATLSADNFNSSSVGSERGRMIFRSNNLTGFGESFVVSGALTDGADEISVSLDVPVTPANMTTQIYYSLSDSRIVERRFDVLDIESETESLGLRISRPLIDSSKQRLSVGIGFEGKRSQSTLLGENFSFSPGAEDGRSSTRAALATLKYEHNTPDQVLAFDFTYRKGLLVGGATEFEPDSVIARLFNPTGADGKFDLVYLQAVFLKRLNALTLFPNLNERAQIVFRTTAQLAFDPLMSLEKIAIGGVNTVRGYPENLLVRDNGLAATLELQLPVPGFQARPHPLNLVVAPFVDYGRSWDEKDVSPLSNDRNTSSFRYLVSAGVGLLWNPLPGLNARLYWGEDLTDNFSGDDPRDTSADDGLQDDGVHLFVSYSKAF